MLAIEERFPFSVRADASSKHRHLPQFPEFVLVLAEQDDIMGAVGRGQCRTLLEEGQLETDDSRIKFRQIRLPSPIDSQPPLEYYEILLMLRDVKLRPHRQQVIKRPKGLHQEHGLQAKGQLGPKPESNGRLDGMDIGVLSVPIDVVILELDDLNSVRHI